MLSMSLSKRVGKAQPKKERRKEKKRKTKQRQQFCRSCPLSSSFWSSCTIVSLWSYPLTVLLHCSSWGWSGPDQALVALSFPANCLFGAHKTQTRSTCLQHSPGYTEDETNKSTLMHSSTMYIFRHAVLRHTRKPDYDRHGHEAWCRWRRRW